MPLFKRDSNKAATAEGTVGSPNKKASAATSPPLTESPQRATSSSSSTARRTVSKPTQKDVNQKTTQVLYRLNYAVKQRPVQPSRSTELIPLNRNFDVMRKNLKALVAAARKYQHAMDEMVKCRSEVISKTAKMTEGTPLEDAIASNKVVLGESLVSLEGKLQAAAEEASGTYEITVLDYVVEWETIVTKKVDSEVKYTNKVHKNLKHYETKLEKLRKTVAAKEEKGKVTPQLKEKLERNEDKLTESWKEYEATATQTCHLIEEATKMGWKDLYPLIQAMLAFESQCDEANHTLRSTNLRGIQNKVSAVVDAHVQPLPASAFTEVVLISRPDDDSDNNKHAEDLDVSEEDE